MIPAAIREEQADACLQAAEQYHAPLLALATKLAGNKEAGKDLFHDVILNCHDAIQRNGFAGDKYQFYLRAAIHNHFKRTKRRDSRTMVVDFVHLAAVEVPEQAPPTYSPELNRWYEKARQGIMQGQGTPAPQDMMPLAAQIQEEITRTFSFSDRVLWRLHIDGMPARDIAAHLQKGDHTGVWRRLDKMREYLRETFQQAWQAFAE